MILDKIRCLQQRLWAVMNSLSFSLRQEAALGAFTLDIVKSSEIEGEKLNCEQVRSSIARRLGIDFAGMTYSDDNIKQIVEITIDATQKYNKPLDKERLFEWHTAFLTREEGKDMDNDKLDAFLHWFNSDTTTDPAIKVAIAHFWFIVISPFKDTNGRLARVISDLLLARLDGNHQRFYSLSSQIFLEREHYNKILQRVKRSKKDITKCLSWFLNCIYNALLATENTMYDTFHKTIFWDRNKDITFNVRQRLMIGKILDGFNKNFKLSDWMKVAKCGKDAAIRDIRDLMEKEILIQPKLAGKNTFYELRSF